MSKNPLKVYTTLRFFSALLFTMIVTVNLVYQAAVVKLNPLQLVLVGTLLETVSFIFEVPTGIVADIYSRKLSVIIGVFLIGLGFTVEGLFPTFLAVLFAQIIWGIGFTFVSGAREAWIADEIGEENAGKAYLKGSQMSQIGALVGIILSMFLANINIRLPIILGGMLYGTQAIFLTMFMPENGFKPTPNEKSTTFRTMKDIFISGLHLVQKSRVLIFIVITGLIFGMFSEGFDRLWTPFMLKTFTFPSLGSLSSVTWFGLINIAATILTIGALWITHKITNTNKHHSVTKTLLAVNTLLSFSIILFGFAGNFFIAILLYCCGFIFREIRNPLYDSWINQNLESKTRATVFSMCSQANAVGQIIGGPILGIIATYVSLRLGIVGAGIILIPTLFLYLYSFKKHKLINYKI